MSTFYPRILPGPKQSFFLFGPRGTGKTTWIREVFEGALILDLLDEGLYQSFLADPSLAADEMRRAPEGSWIVLDEVQRLPWLLNEAHRFMEERRLKFVLCGSSARKLKSAGTNLLASRALRYSMFPLLPEELGRDFDLEKVLTFGSLPVILASSDPAKSLDAYARMYLKEEIQAEALVRNLPGFARFLPVAALFHGQSLNVASLARDSGVGRTTVAGYVEILEDTLLAFRLPAYEGRLRVREKTHPKLYWVDPGIVRALKKTHGPPTPEERGPLLEGLVLVILKAYGEYRDLWHDLYFWSPAEAKRTEVDFLLSRNGNFLALEVKATQRFHEQLLVGLRAIQGLKGLVRRVLVYTGRRTLRTKDGIDALPFEGFCRSLAEGSLWP